MTTEEIFKLLEESKWDELLDFEYKYRSDIINNPSIKQVFDKYFIDALILDLEHGKEQIYSYLIFKRVYQRFIQHRNIIYQIPEETFERFVIIYLKSLQVQNVTLAYNVSKKWSHLEDSQKFILDYEKNQSKIIKHSTEDSIEMKINPNIQEKNHTINLFRSKQEYEFFYAIREYYPNYFTYPNVAVSCIIDYKKIKNNLTAKEKDYFFKAIIDNVVYVQTDKNFISNFYFELDSIYHDGEKEIEKDKMKDKIFSLSGQKLRRIRAINNNNLLRKDFKRLINEVLNKEVKYEDK